MKFGPTPIAGLWEIETQPLGDERGALTRLFCTELFEAIRPGLCFVQANHTVTHQRGTVRGLHFQRAPALEAKLVRCLQGRVHDVVVDLRAGSPTLGRWHAVELSGSNQRTLFIPEGCAHGFQTLTDDVHMLYHHTAPYSAACEDGLRHDDPALAIAWPLPVSAISDRDRRHALIQGPLAGLPL
ncbi:MAG TPA: dTDP-4-dehydrorhamnose 3,5-epimerase family protein [Ideonella sp.]|nr:dTDP-4-dehydrorhamnose 3,5-epimerase family protein [Ideonella sp.]